MARRELALEIPEWVMPLPVVPLEAWEQMYHNPAFLLCLSRIKAAYLRTISEASGQSDPSRALRELYIAEGLKQALKEIEIAEMSAKGMFNKKADNG